MNHKFGYFKRIHHSSPLDTDPGRIIQKPEVDRLTTTKDSLPYKELLTSPSLPQKPTNRLIPSSNWTLRWEGFHTQVASRTSFWSLYRRCFPCCWWLLSFTVRSVSSRISCTRKKTNSRYNYWIFNCGISFCWLRNNYIASVRASQAIYFCVSDYAIPSQLRDIHLGVGRSKCTQSFCRISHETIPHFSSASGDNAPLDNTPLDNRPL